MAYSTASSANDAGCRKLSGLMLCPLLMANIAFQPEPSALLAFLRAPNAAYAWKEVSHSRTRTELKLTSQEWKGSAWNHDIVIVQPGGSRRKDRVAFLVITGDRVEHVDIPFAQKLADASGHAVATLFNVPNQPLFERREDDLIAHSFEQYLETGDPTWPLLFPMVNAASKAMDAIQAVASHHKDPIERFIVTGASKRGWTTWLLGEVHDSRIAGIAPVAFDNLNFAVQLAHQMVNWGHLSEMLGDYESKGLTQETQAEAKRRLIGIVDPFTAVSAVKEPVLVIRGTNDRYWSLDSLSLYWKQVKAPKSVLMLPNEGHGFRDEAAYIASLAAFADDIKRPANLRVSAELKGDSLECGWTPVVNALEVWAATSKTLDFRDSTWRLVETVRFPAGKAKGRHSIDLPARPPENQALLVQFRRGGAATLSSQILIRRSRGA
jgi:PhoPQ-activated pathogenicity-related protein